MCSSTLSCMFWTTVSDCRSLAEGKVHVWACTQTSGIPSCLAFVPLGLAPHSLQSFILSPQTNRTTFLFSYWHLLRGPAALLESELLGTVGYS